MSELEAMVPKPVDEVFPWRRIALTVSYDGTDYAGWQRQQNATGVQQVLEVALSKLTGEALQVTGASRTDAGVHALGQAVHFDTRSRIPGDKFAYAVNTHLPPDIRVTGSRQVEPAFHARYDARGKTYRYQIHNSPHASAIYRNQRAHVVPYLDVETMHEAAQAVLGTHDFRAFAASGSEAKTTVRDIMQIGVTRDFELVELTVSGRSFLYNMVRILAGTLIYIGVGKLQPEALSCALESGDRLDLGITAPAHGLTLMEVVYEETPPWP